ncbi:MAG: transglutaminase domain-containing protein [Niabella sp.]
MKNYSVSESNGANATEFYTLLGYETENTWTAENVPALKEEVYTSSLSNHESKIEFQLSQYRFPNVAVKDIMGNWKTASDEMLKDESFGGEINRPNNWLKDELKSVTEGTGNSKETAYKIYNYIRDNFTATPSSYTQMTNGQTVKDIFRKKNGTPSEINLLLIAMLRNAGIAADPVLISTRSHGWANSFYPLLNKYNLVLAKATIDGSSVFLDATEPRVGFGRLSPVCYNGTGFVVKSTPEHILLSSDSVTEAKTTLIFLSNDTASKGLKGNYSSAPGYYESTRLREKLSKSSLDDLLKETEKGYSFPVTFENKTVDSLNQYDYPVTVKYNMKLNFNDEDIVYFNPMFSEGVKNNPFKSADRKYPVEMLFKIKDLFVLNMEVPKGYVVDEVPKSERVALNDQEGSFDYIIQVSNNRIMLQSKINLNKANFKVEDYQTLRDFFGHIAKKHSELIVFKKVKKEVAVNP